MITEKDFQQLLFDSDNIQIGTELEGGGKECYELAKEMALDFSKWVSSEGYYWRNRLQRWQSHLAENYGKLYSDEELFELYLKSQP
jgi:hypothetical protein